MVSYGIVILLFDWIFFHMYYNKKQQHEISQIIRFYDFQKSSFWHLTQTYLFETKKMMLYLVKTYYFDFPNQRANTESLCRLLLHRKFGIISINQI